jgi:predicted ATPase
LEQPEIHLHPAVQAGLADVLIDAMNRRGIQVILESHSEHLLRRVLRRVAEGTLSSASCALYFCDSVGGRDVLTELQLNEQGLITNWPKGFFGEPLEEAVATTKAAVARFNSAG